MADDGETYWGPKIISGTLNRKKQPEERKEETQVWERGKRYKEIPDLGLRKKDQERIKESENG